MGKLFGSSDDKINEPGDSTKPTTTSRLLRRKSQPRRQSTTATTQTTAAPSRRGSSVLDVYPDSPSDVYQQAYFTNSSSMAARQSPSGYYQQPGVGDDGTRGGGGGGGGAAARPLAGVPEQAYRHSPPPLQQQQQQQQQYNSSGHERHSSQPAMSSFQRPMTTNNQPRPQSQFIPNTQQQQQRTASPARHTNGLAGTYGQPGNAPRPMSYMGPSSSSTPPAASERQNTMYSSPAGSRSQLNESPAPSAQTAPLTRMSSRPQRQGSTSSRNTTQTQQPPPPPKAPSTIGGEPLHDLARAVALLKSSKFYAEGFLMKKVEVGPDGKAHPEANESQWAKWFVQLSGTILSTWNAADMEEAARQHRTVPPQYLNLSDAFLHPYPPGPNRPAPTQFQFALNSAGLNRVLFCAPTLQSLNMWINAIRLAVWERSRCNEIYTGTLLGTREPQPHGWSGYDAGLSSASSKGKFEGWLKIRLPGDTEWRRLWTCVQRGTNIGTPLPEQAKKNKRSSLLSFGKKSETLPTIEGLPGNGTFSTVAFYADKPSKKEQPLCIAQHLFYAAAIYPESEKLINRATLFKIEGTFLNPNDGFKTGWGVGGRAEKQGYALLMLEEGDYMGMLEWIVGLSDAFKLYGRSRGFSWDPRDPSSMYFALPIGPHRDRLFLDRELVDTLDITESRPRAVRAVFHNILFDRMRGVRGPTPSATTEARSGPGTESSSLPQLGPVETIAPIKFGSDQRSEDAHDQQQLRSGYESRTDSPSRRALAPIGESSSLSHPDSNQPTSGSLEWERQQQRDQQDRERQWQESQPSSSVGHSRNGLTAEYHSVNDAGRRHSVMPLHETGSPSMQDHSSAQGATSGVYSSDVSQTGSQREIGGSNGRTSPPAIHPIVTTAPNGNSLNFSRPTPQMFASPTASNQALDQTHSTPQDTVPQYEQPQISNESGSRQVTAAPTNLSSPGAPSLSTAVPDSPTSTSLGYLAPSPHQPQGSSPTYDSVKDDSLHASRGGVGPGAIAGAAAAGGAAAYGVHALHGHDRNDDARLTTVDSPTQMSAPSSAVAEQSPYTTEPSVLATNVNKSSSVKEYQPLMDSGTHVSPIAATQSSTRQQVAEIDEDRFGDSSAPASSTMIAPSATLVEPSSATSRSTANPSDDYNIHSDLLAAINYVDRSSSPPIVTPIMGTPSTVEPSPVPVQPSSFHVGPPKRGLFADESPIIEQGDNASTGANATTKSFEPVETLGDEPRYGAPVQQSSIPPPASSSPATATSASYPSSFAPNKRAEDRLAAAKLAEQAQQAALVRPGRPSGAVNQPKKSQAWVDSDEDDEEEQDEEDSDDDPISRSQPSYTTPASSGVVNHQHPAQRPQMGSLAPNDPRRQSYLERGPSPDNRLTSSSSSPLNVNAPLPPSPSRQDINLPNSTSGNLKPVVSPHGLLHAGILDKEERSAKALEHQAREGGGPLVNLPSKPPPPQTGLVGAITSLEREKERTGGVGRALTEQQRERKLAEQRQRQLDELQRQQLAQQQMQMQAYQMQMAQFGGFGMPGMGSMGGMPGMPWMMPPSASGFGTFPAGSQVASPTGVAAGRMSPVPASPQAGSIGLPGSMSMDAAQFQQQQQQMFAAQQAAQAAAQAAYMQAMATFSQQQTLSTSPGGSPPLNPVGSMSSFPSMQSGFYPPTSAPMGMGFGQFGAFNPYHQSSQQQFSAAAGMGGANADADDEARHQQPQQQGGGGFGARVPPLSMPPQQHHADE
ncbi:hypothetical protein OIO90_000607 [Microbotryomycetes sp. JL221]|nr:hypothetical protein OIO90_000607 [Microbotryomycetes sp. JL221]